MPSPGGPGHIHPVPEGAPKTAVITGASGFIGRRLRDRLLAEGWDVVAIRRPVSKAPQEGRSVVLEYGDRPGLALLFEKERPALVLHVAGATKGVRRDDFWDGNVKPTAQLCGALQDAQHQPERFLLVSSLAAYGPSGERPLIESDPQNPIELYGESKREAERVVQDSGLRFTIVRPSGVYGPGDVDFLELFRWANRQLNVFPANRQQQVSVVYVDDLVDATLGAALHPNTVGRGYFICDGEPVSFEHFQRQIARMLEKKAWELDVPGPVVDLAAFSGELLSKLDGKPRLFNRQKRKLGKANFVCTHQAAKRDFGYTPKVPLTEGLTRTRDWYRQEGWL